MLEAGEILKTWALEAEPSAGAIVPARSLPDHRKRYLDYEGPVSKNRGEVTRWDGGRYRLISKTTQEWYVLLAGQKVRGQVVLRRISTGSDTWTVSFPPDVRARDGETEGGTEPRPRS
jgi:hypothetical protein